MKKVELLPTRDCEAGYGPACLGISCEKQTIRATHPIYPYVSTLPGPLFFLLIP